MAEKLAAKAGDLDIHRQHLDNWLGEHRLAQALCLQSRRMVGARSASACRMQSLRGIIGIRRPMAFL